MLRQSGKPVMGGFSLKRLEKHLPKWRLAAESAPPQKNDQRKVLIVATLRYWIEHATILGLTLAGMGQEVSLAYLPYASWKKPINRFDLRRQDAYALSVLQQAGPCLNIVPLLNSKKVTELPPELIDRVRENARRDTQYTLQVEDINLDSDLYRLRLERDLEAARAAYAWITANRPKVVIIPNGSILEFGAVYQVACYLDRYSFPIKIVTYEFGEQRQRIWLAQNSEVMMQDTSDLWEVRKNQALSPQELEQVRTLFAARQRASLWENFARRWQGAPSEGGEKVRTLLGLDALGAQPSRPVVLLATNVIGDSLTLGRQVFSDSMTEWLERTMQYFAGRSDAQFVVRIHPGELITKGPSVADVAKSVLAEIGDQNPEWIHIIPADAQVNTYDIVEIADLGLVYTTTVGMEMVMSGVPVIVAGKTHYRGKGYTLDVDSWEAYFNLLDQVLAAPQQFRPSQSQVKQAWAYAYRFFFEYPHPFPWHVIKFWDDQEAWSVERVLSPEGQAQFGKTFQYLLGEPVRW